MSIKCDKSEARDARGAGPLIGRTERDARIQEGGRAQRTALLYASAARSSQSAYSRRRRNTLYSEFSNKVLAAPRPPFASQCKSDFVCVVYFPHLNPSLPKNLH
ncbi:hypothetical protein EVAR_13865_1 [Eumeta japonica]|uniref:Uncharacterized protein n=1 Tax=Eumeta variegata TaxID=151549 RepID=A0A4C1U149_EUMVA|nr:hypothetical protein EVAR_13865_1 [Eumeta japonica]